MEFKNKTVIISGGASGIGLLSGECFAKEGANVVLADFRAPALEEAVEKLKTFSENVIGCVTDVTKYDQVEACVKKAKATFGSVDILIPCAGGAETRLLNVPEKFYDAPIDVFDFGLDLNLRGAVYFSHAVLRVMKEQGTGGAIVLLGSISGYEGSAYCVAYGTAKSALMNGTLKSLALGAAEIGVRVNTVAPGPVLTREAMANMKTLMGRAADTQEIVDLIMYLCSDKAAFITGESILIDGGRHLMINNANPKWRRVYEKQ